ncbi:hypothetical protein [Streptomyces virginiae]|uniref:hypothetical protein n=1 Tax=Streptomyces virginiae TaxID=1961 RepID=UPI0035DBBF94
MAQANEQRKLKNAVPGLRQVLVRPTAGLGVVVARNDLGASEYNDEAGHGNVPTSQVAAELDPRADLAPC